MYHIIVNTIIITRVPQIMIKHINFKYNSTHIFPPALAGYLFMKTLMKAVKCATPSTGMALYIEILIPGQKECPLI